ncbi:MAG: 3-dehydroquinate synthase [Ferruginibacter sp.]
MKVTEQSFPGKKVSYYFDADFSYLDQIVAKDRTILITDENIFRSHPHKFSGWETIVIKAGETFKQQAAVDGIIEELITKEAGRNTTIVGVGGGVVTDVAGYAAGIYMRGLKFGFIPTTVLAMVDAAIGGKNGVDVGVYKNLVGLIKQPDFLLFDYSFLEALPNDQWVNGFAEIIKHACIKDAALFAYLENESLESFQSDKNKLADLVERNVNIKTTVVVNDEFEKGDRMLLNFGHTLGHAIENIYELPHGHAVSIGMIAASTISSAINNFPAADRKRIIDLVTKYHLPVTIQFDRQKILNMLKRDKKRASNDICFILLNKIGEAVARPIPISQLESLIDQSL